MRPPQKPKSVARGFAWSGIVSSHIPGPATKAGSALRELPAVIGAVQAGLPFAEVEALRAGLALPLDKLAPELGLSKATLHRRKLEGRLASSSKAFTPDAIGKPLPFAFDPRFVA